MKTIRQTSIDCYNQILAEGLLSKRRLEVLEAIMKNAPCTTNEATKDLPSGSHGIGSRTTELRELGVIYERCVRKCKETGRNVIEWDLTDKLPIKIKKATSPKQQRVEKAINALKELYQGKDRDKWLELAELIKAI